jgi:hypothetical protein
MNEPLWIVGCVMQNGPAVPFLISKATVQRHTKPDAQIFHHNSGTR